ncbi:uncharacterized protein KY384_001985 [Bacidia gigantensis]|uniref:uncharacterized protein n=1 Tax=Bacidia gigantensis TaxID=2732470 RepID=UPI001D03C7FD|nr:uncharacterized protein KY384_001985 [Bacidia gigantensis]KAG8533202.1 hypothetical protein KY384_001985 [Bacidia gigantensis]
MAPLPTDVLVRVTAGPTYDPSTHQTVLVNSATPTHITSPNCTANLSVRIQNYRGLPPNSPKTSPYFSHPTHKSDQYSISFTLLPHKTISGQSLVFGNDIDHPVRDKLPYGTGAAFKILKRVIDPGLDGDLYADKPHLYGCALSSLNVINVGEKVKEGQEPTKDGELEEVIEEGGDGDGAEWRTKKDVPETAGKRRSWFLGSGKPETWKWEEGRVYKCDFFNPYLDFNGEVLFVVVFSLVRKDALPNDEHTSVAKSSIDRKDDPAVTHEDGEKFRPSNDDVD